MEAATTTRIGEGAEPIESMEWLREFGERYLAAWNSSRSRRRGGVRAP